MDKNCLRCNSTPAEDIKINWGYGKSQYTVLCVGCIEHLESVLKEFGDKVKLELESMRIKSERSG